MNKKQQLYFFKCSVSKDLYGVSLNSDSSPLPTPANGDWLPIEKLTDIGKAANGFKRSAAENEITKWNCHWFTSKGPRQIYWGPGKKPKPNQ